MVTVLIHGFRRPAINAKWLLVDRASQIRSKLQPQSSSTELFQRTAMKVRTGEIFAKNVICLDNLPFWRCSSLPLTKYSNDLNQSR